MRALPAVAALSLLACGTARPADVRPEGEPDAATLARLAHSVLRVEAAAPGSRLRIGSGVVVAEGRVVTSCHVTRQARALSVGQGGARWPARLLSPQPARDLCLLAVEGLPAPAVPLGSVARLQVGDPLLALGFTGGAGLHVSAGRVVALHRWDGSRVIRSSSGFTSGASGGGLFDARHELVGILTFRLRGGESHYFAAPADWLRDPPALTASAPEPAAAPSAPGFWEQAGEARPTFLQAAALEQTGQWQALAALAGRWARESPDEAEAPYLEGVAEEALGHPEQALAAWRRSLELDPGFHRSWLRLAPLYRRLGRESEARRALTTLHRLNPALGRELADAMPTAPGASSPTEARP